MKLPEVITFEDNKTITTEYDAEGTKLKKIVSGGETTDYGGSLKFGANFPRENNFFVLKCFFYKKADIYL